MMEVEEFPLCNNIMKESVRLSAEQTIQWRSQFIVPFSGILKDMDMMTNCTTVIIVNACITYMNVMINYITTFTFVLSIQQYGFIYLLIHFILGSLVETFCFTFSCVVLLSREESSMCFGAKVEVTFPILKDSNGFVQLEAGVVPLELTSSVSSIE